MDKELRTIESFVLTSDKYTFKYDAEQNIFLCLLNDVITFTSKTEGLPKQTAFQISTPYQTFKESVLIHKKVMPLYIAYNVENYLCDLFRRRFKLTPPTAFGEDMFKYFLSTDELRLEFEAYIDMKQFVLLNMSLNYKVQIFLDQAKHSFLETFDKTIKERLLKHG